MADGKSRSRRFARSLNEASTDLISGLRATKAEQNDRKIKQNETKKKKELKCENTIFSLWL
jgi:hypothetical protein